MKTRHILVALLALVLVACGGDTDTSDGGDDGQASTDQTQVSDNGEDDGGGDTGDEFSAEMDPNFDPGVIPADFPSDLFPDEFDSGMYGELGSVRNANFLVNRSFDEIVADYTARIGEEPIVVEGEQSVATWTVDGEWAVSVIGGDPALIGIAHTG